MRKPSLAASATAGCLSEPLGGLEAAGELLFEKKYVEAELSYRKLLKRLNNIQARSERQEAQRLTVLDRLGHLSNLYLRNYRQALSDFELLVRDYPKSDQAFSAHLIMADIHRHKLNQPEQALDQLNHAIENFPWRPETRRALLELTTLYIELKNYEQARTEGQALIDKWPQSREAREAYFLVANSYYVQNRYSEAIQVYEALSLSDNDPSLKALVNFELASCYQELGDYKKALELYYQTLSEHPNPVLVQRNIKRVRARVRQSGAQPSIYRATPITGRKARPNLTKPAAQRTKTSAKPRSAKAKPAPIAQPTVPKKTGTTTAAPKPSETKPGRPEPAAPAKAATAAPKPPKAPAPNPKPAAKPEPAAPSTHTNP